MYVLCCSVVVWAIYYSITQNKNVYTHTRVLAIAYQESHSCNAFVMVVHPPPRMYLPLIIHTNTIAAAAVIYTHLDTIYIVSKKKYRPQPSI